jgi:hypothetical protein
MVIWGIIKCIVRKEKKFENKKCAEYRKWKYLNKKFAVKIWTKKKKKNAPRPFYKQWKNIY